MARKSSTATALAIAAGFSFYVLCMILPLVGPAGSRMPNIVKNKGIFLAVLLITSALAAASVYVSLQLRKDEGGTLPRFSLGLSLVCVLFLIVFLLNGFSI